MIEDAHTLSSAHYALLHLPILTTFCAAFFCWQLFSRYRAKGGGRHLLWWGIGMATYGLGTLTESLTTLLGWDPLVFRFWYIAGAFLGGYPLAQGSIYLLMRRRFADLSAILMTSAIAIASVLVFLSPLDASLAEAHRLSGKVIEWHWVRLISPFLNLYSLVFLVGGAIFSALKFRRHVELRDRYVGNILIAIGALLPGIGGTLTRAGFVEALYVTELVGLLLIYTGYRRCIRGREATPVRHLKTVAQAVGLLLGLLLVSGAAAQTASDDTTDPASPDATATADGATSEEPQGSFFATTTVTATGSESETFEVTNPVTVVNQQTIEERAPDNPTALLRDQPGVDVNGVGPNQQRPVIRGQRGLRVLFLENGLRMNNPRRQSDFGEITGLSEVEEMQSLEVVRGPASVLYGSDAIGGVINVITKTPAYRDAERLGGSVALRYGSAGEQEKVSGSVDGRFGAFSLRLGASYRDSGDYKAAAGSFGKIRLRDEAVVRDSGVRDDTATLFLGYDLAENHKLSLRHSRYSADQTGFGFVDPALIGDDSGALIRILYPDQKFDRTVLHYLGSALATALLDTVDLQVYRQSNERHLANLIDINIGPLFPGAPDSAVHADTMNFTDLDTTGLRAELIKVFGVNHLVTYGFEGYQDDSFNTDFSTTTTTLRFPFPPFEIVRTSSDGVANAPNATNTSYGAFVQDEITAGERLKLTLGARYQNVSTKAERTPGWDTRGLDFDDDALVGSFSALYRVADYLHLAGSVGTAFRAPSIIERLFNGPTPEGAGYQILNAGLQSENSTNYDLGFKYLRTNAIFELTFFRNEIKDGIVQYFLSPSEVAALPAELQAAIEASGGGFVVQQRNIEKLRYEGAEASVGYRAPCGVALGGNYTHLTGKRIDSTNPPTGDTFGDKLNLYLRWSPPAGRYFVEYRLRHNGEEKANLDPNEPEPPVGRRLPAFTTHSLSGGVHLFDHGRFKHSLTLVADNLTDELYAEFSNVSFFRPQPGRNFTLTYRLGF